jgi:hypothetical protein
MNKDMKCIWQIIVVTYTFDCIGINNLIAL